MRDTTGCFFTIIPSKSRKGLILLLHYECPLWRRRLAQCVKPLLPTGSSFLSTNFLAIRKPKYSCRSIYVSASPPQNPPITYDTRDAIKKAFHSLFHAELSFQTHDNRSMFPLSLYNDFSFTKTETFRFYLHVLLCSPKLQTHIACARDTRISVRIYWYRALLSNIFAGCLCPLPSAPRKRHIKPPLPRPSLLIHTFPLCVPKTDIEDFYDLLLFSKILGRLSHVEETLFRFSKTTISTVACLAQTVTTP